MRVKAAMQVANHSNESLAVALLRRRLARALVQHALHQRPQLAVLVEHRFAHGRGEHQRWAEGRHGQSQVHGECHAVGTGVALHRSMNRERHGRRTRTLLCLLAALSAGACSADGAEPPAGRGSPPAGWDDGLRLPEAAGSQPRPRRRRDRPRGARRVHRAVAGTPSPSGRSAGCCPGPSFACRPAPG